MAISVEEVKHIAELARLQFSEEELLRMADELERILGYVHKLNELDTSDVPATSHVHVESGGLRTDTTVRRIDREEALKNAPDSDGVYFRVPRVINSKQNF